MTTRSIVCADGAAHLFREHPIPQDQLALLEAKVAAVLRRHNPGAIEVSVSLKATMWLPTTTSGYSIVTTQQEATPCQEDKAEPTTSENSHSTNSEPLKLAPTTSTRST